MRKKFQREGKKDRTKNWNEWEKGFESVTLNACLTPPLSAMFSPSVFLPFILIREKGETVSENKE